ncbi:winged helix-turn-helix transcriptional regulator [Tumebacillus sp. ITR2]|uniref:Winged helix-turn-helix transcriptional regulator n=1 Tax=Tumebacillus amylolyticus TaxID=2801339 RepID=A0ABS1J755_9BACL|nr:metalloregulator ArsR/SmtB family transcription factor [Tumebacillus amylolyticus]MBL0386084.1 winged helix-turn-helix transcriptional regulator [Tumebacillus amylolyticus]
MSSAAKVDVFQAVADPTRRTLLKLLGKQELSVAQMTGHFSISRTAVNKHLHILSQAGLVSHHKVGRETRYQLQPDKLRELQNWVNYFEQFWDNKLAMLKFLVEQDDESEPVFPPLRLVDREKE